MKIAIDCRMIGSGGIGSYLESLLPFFTNDFECLLLGNEKSISSILNNHEPIPEIIDCQIPCFSIKELLGFPKSLIHKINQCDCYYTPYCNIPKGIRIPIFTTIHDVVFLDVPGLTSKTGVLVRKLFYQRAINKSKKIFTVSDFSCTRIKENLKLRKKDIIVTYNAVPERYINTESNNIAKNDSILFVGNIKRHKGLRTLLKAFEILNKSNPDLKLIIVGNAENFRTGDREISDLLNAISNDRIKFTGRISNDELKHYYQTSRLLIQPSLYEGFGMPPLEALYCGTNVVISDIPVFKEIYKDYPVTYFHCEDADDLARKIKYSLMKEKPEISVNVYSFQRTYDIIKKELN